VNETHTQAPSTDTQAAANASRSAGKKKAKAASSAAAVSTAAEKAHASHNSLDTMDLLFGSAVIKGKSGRHKHLN